MRSLSLLVLTAGATLGALSSIGCYSLSADCELNFNCEGGSGGGGGTTTGGTAGAPPGCVPANNTAPIENDCGVFVSSTKGEDSNEGTKEKPFATFAKAFGAAKGKPVYACGEALLESVEVSAGASIYGGLDCSTDWKYDASKPTLLSASQDMVPLRVGTKTSVEVYDVIIRADSALVIGGSSIAVIAEGESDVTLTRCTVQAGDGSNGANGEDFIDPAISGTAGFDGLAACSNNQVITLDPPITQCGDVQSIGGLGGIGTSAQGGAGSPGEPQGAMNGGIGEGGAVCTAGGPGDAGLLGAPGDGATSLGSLQAGLGFSGASGADGQLGAPAQGGGGGGGAKGGTGAGKCAAGMTGGASGGTGGTGGCGGLGGKGGTGGGASIGIVSLGAKLTFSEVTIETKGGGKGGNGGLGQTGGDGGLGGLGGSKGAAVMLNNGCAGGVGGKGGDGGKGGGGRGGHSIGIAHTGEAPDTTGATITTGTPGNGGAGEGDPGSGAPGAAEKTQAFN